MAIVGLQVCAIERQETGPVEGLTIIVRRHDRKPTDKLALFVRHLEEQQGRKLLQVILVGQPIIAKYCAVGPEFSNDVGAVRCHSFIRSS